MWKRVAGFVALVIAVWAAAGIFSAQSACAHDPRFVCSPRTPQHPVVVSDPAKSWAFYGGLDAGGTDTFSFTLERELVVPFNLLVDRRDSENSARPVLRILRNGKQIAAVDFSRSEAFYEPFSRENYVQTPQHKMTLPPGAYVARVAMPGATSRQRYVFALGEAERFSVFEVPYVLGAIHRVRALSY